MEKSSHLSLTPDKTHWQNDLSFLRTVICVTLNLPKFGLCDRRRIRTHIGIVQALVMNNLGRHLRVHIALLTLRAVHKGLKSNDQGDLPS